MIVFLFVYHTSPRIRTICRKADCSPSVASYHRLVFDFIIQPLFIHWRVAWMENTEVENRYHLLKQKRKSHGWFPAFGQTGISSRLDRWRSWIKGPRVVFWPHCPLWTRGAFYLKVQYFWIGKAFKPARFVIRHPLASCSQWRYKVDTKTKVKVKSLKKYS